MGVEEGKQKSRSTMKSDTALPNVSLRLERPDGRGDTRREIGHLTVSIIRIRIPDDGGQDTDYGGHKRQSHRARQQSPEVKSQNRVAHGSGRCGKPKDMNNVR